MEIFDKAMEEAAQAADARKAEEQAAAVAAPRKAREAAERALLQQQAAAQEQALEAVFQRICSMY